MANTQDRAVVQYHVVASRIAAASTPARAIAAVVVAAAVPRTEAFVTHAADLARIRGLGILATDTYIARTLAVLCLLDDGTSATATILAPPDA